jgi:hypothetical protein
MYVSPSPVSFLTFSPANALVSMGTEITKSGFGGHELTSMEVFPKNPRDITRGEIIAIFRDELRPDDLYKGDIYWADLPFWERMGFVWAQHREDAGRECRAAWTEFKKDPLSPLRWYFRNAVLPGAGLLIEGAVLFSTSHMRPLFEQIWPECWKDYKTCSKTWVEFVSYSSIAGIMIGQVVMGVCALLFVHEKPADCRS